MVYDFENFKQLLECSIKEATLSLCLEFGVKLKHGIDVKIIDDPLTLSFSIYLCIDYKYTYKLKLNLSTLLNYSDMSVNKEWMEQLRPIIKELREEQLILELANIK